MASLMVEESKKATGNFHIPVASAITLEEVVFIVLVQAARQVV
jgi:hypothetical protein